ncbi:MAG TPA: hypothetical protein VFA99_18595 [Acidobacteriaceae bacterium]|nr:hypothetical protein [Acidobacteriaceae bacterium]
MNSKMEDELDRLIERVESDEYALAALGIELRNAAGTPFSTEEAQSFSSRAVPLTGQVERTMRAISKLADRCEAANVKTSEIRALRDVAVELAGEIGSLSAIVDIATGELPGWGNPNKTRNEIGIDILRAARELQRPALHLSRIRAMKSPKRFAVGASIRIKNPGIEGVVTQLDSERSSLSEYWHTIKTKYGERREPGCNLELIEPPISHASTKESPMRQTFNIHGPNARVNIDSIDNSTNVVHQRVPLSELRKAIESGVSDGAERAAILQRLSDLEAANDRESGAKRYQAFIAAAANHMTLIGPYLPALGHWVHNLLVAAT